MSGVVRVRKRPVEHEAMRFLRGAQAGAIARWCGGTAIGAASGRHIAYISVPTLHGPARADYGDWIVKGELDCWPVDHEQFQATYEVIPDE